jgi:DNA polymerase-3 subunit gamma/tau
MTYEPLHHKYRPQSFGELVGQEAIAATLTNAIEQQRIAPAYLFTGARGTGKTSSARILAKSLNCLKSKVPTATPCGVCDVCQAIARGSALDVIEIDAASNTGVDNIRELIERAQFAPVQCRYKVYIIDEVHMLSTAAFNALLKTLEEPPDRVVFVLATTDPQRVLPTIISRCQRFDYRRIPLEAMVAHLHHIATQEHISITSDALTLVAQMAQGGLRDAESLLDQLSLLPGEISVEQVWELVGSVPERDLLELLQAIVQDNPEPLLDSTRRLMDRGREPLIVLQNLASFYRDLLIAKTAPSRHDLVTITLPTWQQLCDLAQTFDLFTILAGQQHLRSAEVQLKHTTQPRLWLEVALMGLLPSAVGQEESKPHHQTLKRNMQAAIAPEHNSVEQPQPQPSANQPKFENSKPQEQADHSGAERTEKQDTTRPASDFSTVKDQTPPPTIPPSAQGEETTTDRDRSLPTSLDLNKIWQDVIREMVPYSSQVMVRQQCRLKGFDGQQARIAVSTQPLLKMAQTKLPNIEAAFEAVFSRKIHIALEVSPGAAIADTPPLALPPKPPPQPPEQAPEPTASPPKTSAPPQPPEYSPPELPPVPAPQAPPPQTQRELPTSEPETAAPPHPLPPDNGWEMEDEATQAAKKLAEFFAGKVVDLSDDASSDAPPHAAKSEFPSELEFTTSTSNSGNFWKATEAGVNPLAEEDGELDEDDDVPF